MAIDKEKIRALFWRAEYYGAITDGGVPSLYNGLTEGLLKLGHECIFASGGRLKLNPQIKTFYIPYSKFLRNYPEVLSLPYNRKAIKWMKKIIEAEKPDFLFQHHHDFNWTGSLLKKDLGIPFLLHCDSIEYWVKKNWGKLYLGNLLKWSEEIQWDRSDAIFVVSTALRQQLIEHGVDSNKIVVNPNGVNPDVFSPEIDGTKIRKILDIKDKFVCGFSGTFGQWHGLDVIAKAVKIVKEKIPNVFFLFVGDGVLRPLVEDIIKKDNIGQYCHITGMVEGHKVPEYLAACDILLTPCVPNEDNSAFINSPIKLYEYLSMGKAIVATAIGQQGDVINDRQNGLICEENSPEDLAEKIIDIYSDRSLAESLAGQARRDALAKYDWKYSSNRIIHAYKNVIAGKNANDINPDDVYGC